MILLHLLYRDFILEGVKCLVRMEGEGPLVLQEYCVSILNATREHYHFLNRKQQDPSFKL